MTSFRSTLHSFDLLVVFVEESLLEEDEIILCHDLPAQHHRQELVVGDVLVQRGHDVLGLLYKESRHAVRETSQKV